jgi:hypothetical protein
MQLFACFIDQQMADICCQLLDLSSRQLYSLLQKLQLSPHRLEHGVQPLQILFPASSFLEHLKQRSTFYLFLFANFR